MFKYILFDFDGTVFDTVEGITKSVRYAINLRGMDAELDSLRCFAGPPLVDMFMEHFGFTQAEAEQATADFRVRYEPTGLHECCVFPGVAELLKALRAHGLVTAVATSKPEKLARELLEENNMLGLFDAICGSRPNGKQRKQAKNAKSRRADASCPVSHGGSSNKVWKYVIKVCRGGRPCPPMRSYEFAGNYRIIG